MDYLAYIPGLLNEIAVLLIGSPVGLAFCALGLFGFVVASLRRLML